jgi:hypothetical protein
MTIKLAKLLSGRVQVTGPTGVTADRYQFLGVNQAEPNLGFSANGNVLTTDIYGSRIWSNVLNISSITLTGNLSTTANVIAGYVRTDRYQWANGAPFLSSSYGNADVAGYLLKNDVTIGGNLTVQGNVTIVNTEVVNTTEYVNLSIATTVNAATIGNIGANLVGSGQYITGVVASSVSNATTVATANVSIHQQLASSTTNQTHYLPFYRQLTGNADAYTNSGLTYNPNNGTLSASYFSGIGSFTSLSTSGVSTLGGNVVLTNGTPTNDNTTGALVLTGTGGAAIGGNVNINGQIFIGAGAQEAGIVNATLVARGSSESGSGLQYTQFALFNTTSSGSTDFAAYPNNLSADQAHGWVDVGITGDAFNDPAYTITKPNDSYLFGSGANATVGGNLILATDFSGSYNDIIVATGGFSEASEVARFHGNATTGGYLVLKQGTAASSTTTGALRVQGGVGVTGNVYAGNVITTGNIIGGGVRSTTGATAPTAPTVGDMWYNTTNDILYRYTYDGTSNNWLDIISAPSAFGNLSANSGIASTSTTTGTFVVWGGAGVTGNVNAGAFYSDNYLFANGVSTLSAGSSSYGNTQVAAYLPLDPTITGIQANLGAFEIYANANLGTATTNINSINANLGSYQTYANANAATQATAINSLYLNANANTAAYLTTATGDISAGNITNANLISSAYLTATSNVQTATLNVTANAYVGNVITDNFYHANGQVISLGGNYGNTQVAAYLLIDPTITGIQANLGAFEIYANANAGAIFNSVNSINANLGSYQNTTNANLGTATTNINSIDANVGAYQTYANANLGATFNSINSINANLGSYQNTTNANIGTIYTTLNTLDANVGAFEIYANANIGSLLANAGNQQTAINSLNANVGAYEIYANANIGTIETNLQTLTANVGAYEIYANANIGTVFNSVNSINANLGTYQNTTNANIGTVFTRLNTLDANVGAYEIYANANAAAQAVSIGSLATNANANTAAYLDSAYNLTVGQGTTFFNGNVSIAGNLTLQGNAFSISSTDVAIQDSILKLHTPANLAPLIGNDGRDIGISFHYYDYEDSHAFLGRNNVNGYLEWIDRGTESFGNVFSGTFGTINSGELILANTTASTSNTTGALRVAGGAGIAGNLYVGGNLVANGVDLVANAGSQSSSINSINANVGAYQTYANANIGAIFNSVNSINANLGSYQNTTNANLGTATTNINSINANLGAYETWANATFGTSSYSNTNVATYLTSYTGNITAGNIVANGNVTAANFIGNLYGTATGGSITGANLLSTAYLTATANVTTANITVTANAYIGNILATNFYFANGTPFVSASGSTSTYSNANVIANLQNLTTNIVTTANVTANNFIGNLYGSGSGGFITGANLLSAGYLTATSNVQTVNLNVSANAYVGNVLATQYLYANGVSILTGIGGTYSNANVVANLQNFVTAISTTANITTTANIISPNYLFANGVNILSTVSAGAGTYSNTNVAAYLTSYTGNITAGNIVATGNVTATNFIGNLYGAGSGGYITGANLLSAQYLTATANVTTANINVSANAYIGNIIGTNFYYANGRAISFGSTGSSYGNTEVAAYIKIDPTVTAIQANLGTYQNTTNANVGSVFTRFNTLDANVGAFEIYANANIGTATTKIDSLRTGANANTAAYISTYTGNISAGNINVTSNVYAAYFVGGIQSTGSGGNISGANVISANSFVASGNVYAAGYYFSNGTPYSYGNVQVAQYLPTYEGNVAYANIAYFTTPVSTSSSATFYPEFASSTSGNTRMYVNSSLTYVPSSGTLTATIFSGQGSFSTLTASSTATLSGVVTLNSGAATNNNSTGALIISGSGGLAVSGNVNLLNQLFVGTGSQATSLVNPVVTVRGTSTSGAGSQFTQSALINATDSGSSDFIAYGDNYGGVTADHGWMDVGYTGSAFSDAAYTITGANDGYVFAGAVNNTLGGNLVLATDKIGYYKDIVLAVGSFYANSEVARFSGNAVTGGYFELKQGTAATSTTTGALRVAGGVGVTGNVWAGNVLATGFFYANGMAFVGGGGGGGTSFTGGMVTSGIYPNANLTLDLGTASAYWRSTYTGNIITTGGIFWSNGIAYSSGGGGGGGGTAAGDNFSLQYNNGGSFGGTNFLYFSGNGTIATPTGNIEAGGARSTTGTTPPANPTVGDVWYNSTTDVTFRYQYDGTNKYWVDIGGPAVVSTAIGTPQGRSIAFSLIFGG